MAGYTVNRRNYVSRISRVKIHKNVRSTQHYFNNQQTGGMHGSEKIYLQSKDVTVWDHEHTYDVTLWDHEHTYDVTVWDHEQLYDVILGTMHSMIMNNSTCINYPYRNEWETFNPRTNIMWLHYLVDKLLNQKKYKRNGRDDREAMRYLRQFHKEVLSYDSATHLILESELFET